MNGKLFQILAIILLCSGALQGQQTPTHFTNPILPGFNPDPSICRVGSDYYLVTSSFLWYPGIPVYHSRDLVNWKLIGHGIHRPNQIKLNGLMDKNGIWAVTIRYHDGLFYLITACDECGGNFYITAKDPRGPWSDPVWLKDAPGIDPSLFWDEDGKCYYTGNFWGFKGSWPGHVSVWGQELDLQNNRFIGERKQLTSGHANNASHAESPHLYKNGDKYLLMVAEGGTDIFHAVTSHQSSKVLGPFVADKINPVLSHRQFGSKYPLQAIGHSDLVQTQNGDWWAVVLGKRFIDGNFPLSRETFLCKVEFENGIPIFNPGFGKVLTTQKRPDLPFTPWPSDGIRDNFNTKELALKWHFVRIPDHKFYDLRNGQLKISLQPESIDSLRCAPMLLQKIQHTHFEATSKLNFSTSTDNEAAGIVLHRGAGSYFTLLKTKSEIILTRKFKGKKEIIARAVYRQPTVCLRISVKNMNVAFSFGESTDHMRILDKTQSLVVTSEGNGNKFNGPGVGIYASSNGKKSVTDASYDWFEYKPSN